MILNYRFEDIVCEQRYDALDHINHKWFEEKTYTTTTDVEYEYDVDVSFEDFFDFIKPHDFRNWKEDGRNAYERACRDVWNSDWFRIDDLEEDEDFIQFMTDRYESDAHDKCQEEYD